ncbi:MAG: argininosuccinate lyase [Clostridia bacterium]|nr:argininosuccinate lyase [Clostridia bacterium]
MKLWQGRFKKDVDSRVNDFNSSISFDGRMYRQDINGSIAHATMLGECGIIEKSESEKIVAALRQILADIEDGKIEFSIDAEDIHMNIETILTSRIGDTGKRLHTARSRNDQVALDVRMYLLDEIKEIKARVLGLLEAISDKAKLHTDTVMAGYTHLQRAQPVTFAHYILAYAQMLMRDYDRLCDTERRTSVMPLGSGALASTTYPINRERVAELLGFPKVTENSIDGVSDRDFVLELASDLSLLMMHMSRFSEEIILWCSSEFGFIELDDAFSTGSSIMPQKKNPDVAELVRGKTGRVYGDMMALYSMMKSLPLAYNKDMQEDKEAIFDAIDNTLISLEVFTSMFATMTVRADRLRRAAAQGFINATDCADYLVKKGMPFRDAYKVSGTLVAYCIDNAKTLEELSLDEYRAVCDIFESDVYEAIDLMNCVNGRKVRGGPAKESVLYQIELVDKFLEENK